MMRRLSTRLYFLFGRNHLERELDTELKYHLDMLVEQNVKCWRCHDAHRRGADRVPDARAPRGIGRSNGRASSPVALSRRSLGRRMALPSH